MSEKSNQIESDVGGLALILLMLVILGLVLAGCNGFFNGKKADKRTSAEVVEVKEDDTTHFLFKGHDYRVVHRYRGVAFHDPECVKCKEGK